jgi:hypothetical protein
MRLTSGCGGVYRTRLSHRTVPHPKSELPARQGPLEADVAVAGDEDLEAVALGGGQQRAVGQPRPALFPRQRDVVPGQQAPHALRDVMV